MDEGATARPTDDIKCIGGYRKIRDLGMGSFGKAILVEHIETGLNCVMKAIDITRLQPQQRIQSINEVKVLGQMKHPFIIQYKESFIVNGFLCIITEFAEGGDLSNAINKRREARRLRSSGAGIANNMSNGFPERQVIRWIIQCLLALKYLHHKHILHRDVKTQNIFLSMSGRIRLGDFGISKMLDKTGSFASTVIGTPYYLSPEICRSMPYSWSSDIWSLGCVLYELCALKVPFQANNMTSLITRIVHGRPPPLPPQYSKELQSLFQAMLNKNPSERPTPSRILSIPFIRNECLIMFKEDSNLRTQICPPTPESLKSLSTSTDESLSVLRQRRTISMPEFKDPLRDLGRPNKPTRSSKEPWLRRMKKSSFDKFSRLKSFLRRLFQ